MASQLSETLSRPAAEQTARLGKPTLTLADAIAQSLAIGPVFSATFLAALIAGAAGPNAPLATILGIIGSLCVGWVVVLYARRYAGAGAIYDYVQRASSPTHGLLAAGMYFIGTLLLGGAGIYLLIGFFAEITMSGYLGLSIPWWAWALVAALVVFFLNHRGIQIATRGQLMLTALSAIPLVILALAIIVQGGAAGNTTAVFTPSVSFSELFRGMLFAITLFIGFEASASLGEETANPRQAIPRAVIGTILIGSVFYMLVIYASTIGFGLDKTAEWAGDPSPLATLANRYVGAWLAPWLDLAVLIDMLAVASAFTATSGRGWFALARHGLLPAPLARTSRYHTPVGGNLLVLSSALVLTLIVAATGLDVLVAFGITTLWGSVLIELIYIALAVIAAWKFAPSGRPWLHWLIILGAIITPILALYGTVVPFPAWPANAGVFGALLSIVLVVIWTAAMRRFASAQLASIAAESLSETPADEGLADPHVVPHW